MDKYGVKRDFKVYVADKFQATKKLEQLAKTQKGQQRTKSINLNWEYLKHKAKENLSSEKGSTIYQEDEQMLKQFSEIRRVILACAEYTLEVKKQFEMN